MTAKRCYGYPSRTAAIIGLRAKGSTTAEIAAHLKLGCNVVRTVEKTGLATRKRREEWGERQSLTLPDELLLAMVGPATARGLRPGDLARSIVEHVVEHDLIDAVLDDRKDLVDA